jgi:hypothetical protein
MVEVLWPQNFSQKLEQAKKVDQLWSGIHSEPWSNCFGFVLFMFFPDMLDQQLKIYRSVYEHPRQYYSPLVFSEKAESFPNLEFSNDQENYNVDLAAQAHFVTVQRLGGGTHNYIHSAIISPLNIKQIIHRPGYNQSVAGPESYKKALSEYLPSLERSRMELLFTKGTSKLKYIFKFWTVKEVLT